MNSKKFTKMLNQYYEQDMIYPMFINWAYKNDKKSFFHDKNLISLLKQYYEELVSKCSSNYRFLLVSELNKKNEMKQFIKDKIPFLLSFVDSEYSFYQMTLDCSELKIKDFINSNFSPLMSKIPNICFYSMISRGEVDDKNKEIANNFLASNKNEYIEFLLGNKISKDTRNYDDVIDITVKLVDEILKHENLKYIDIRRLNSGAFSDVINIGSKVIKLGKQRNNYLIPNSEYLLKPYIRVNLRDISDVDATLEVVEKVDTYGENINLYDFYKTLRKKGIVWLDIKSNNLGYLLKDNTFHWNKSLGKDMSIRGIIGENDCFISAKGSPVILDSDHLYSEDNFNLLSTMEDVNFKNLPGYQFEERYKKELADMIIDKEANEVDDKKVK